MMKLASCLMALAMAHGVLSTCSVDNCARAVTGSRTGKMPDATSRKADCSSFMLLTVTPATSTATTVTTVTTTTTLAVLKKRETALLEQRQVTVTPKVVPSYASACSGAVRYSSACSCWGITAMATTVATPVTTTTVTVTATVSVCPAGSSNCGVSCSNLQTDVKNCGSCGNTCPSGGTCNSGTCSCSTGLSLCNGACVNYQNDPSNCATCGNQCASGVPCTLGSCSRCIAPPNPYSSIGSTRSYALQDSTCNGSPGCWFLLNDQLDQFSVGCSGHTDGQCAISACASHCDSRSDCVGFLVQSDDSNDGYDWLCSVDGDRTYTREYDGAIYGDEYIYALQ